MPNTGSFGASVPGGEGAVAEAIARRQQGAQPIPQLQQQGPAQTPPLPSPQGQAGPSQQGQAPGALTPAESELIVKSLGQRLSSISAVEKAKAIPQQGGLGG